MTLLQALREGRPSPIPIVDAHAHLGPWGAFEIPERGSLASMLAVMDRVGVERVALSSHLAIAGDAREGNRLTLAAKDAAPARVWGYLVVSPHEAWDEAQPSSCLLVPGVVGLKLHPETYAYPVTGEGYAPALAWAEAVGLPVLVHCQHGSPFCSPGMLGRVASRYPRLPLILGHMGVTPAGFREAVAVARDHPWVYLEICGSHMTADWLAWTVARVGVERVVFGSDVPFIDLRYSVGRVAMAQLGEEAERRILRDNFLRLVGQRRAGTV